MGILLPLQEHAISLHFCFLCNLWKVLQFSFRLYAFFVNFFPRYFMAIVVATVNGPPVLCFLIDLCQCIRRLAFLLYSFCKVIQPSITMLTLPTDSPASFRQEVISSAHKCISLFYLCLFNVFSLTYFHGYWPVPVSILLCYECWCFIF